MRSGDTDVSMEGHLGAKISWCSPKTILTKTWACPSCWISWCMWYLYLSCIFLIRVRIFLKLFDKTTLVDRSQDVEKNAYRMLSSPVCLLNQRLLVFLQIEALDLEQKSKLFGGGKHLFWFYFFIYIDCSIKENGSSCHRGSVCPAE